MARGKLFGFGNMGSMAPFAIGAVLVIITIAVIVSVSMKKKTPAPTPIQTPVVYAPAPTPIVTPVVPSPAPTPAPSPATSSNFSPKEGTNEHVACNNSETFLTATGAYVLKDKPSDPDVTSFTDPLYLGWVNKAVNRERALNASNPGRNAKYVNVWNNGGYRSFKEEQCATTSPISNTKIFKIN